MNRQQNPVVCILGLGYVGLTFQLVLAQNGFRTIGVDRDSSVIQKLKLGTPHFHEVGLAELLITQNMSKNAPIFQTSVPKNIASVYVVTVGTPILRPSLEPNLSYVENAITDIGRVLKKGDTVILRSTVPVGTTRSLVVKTLETESGLSVSKDFYLCFCPERTIEGKALRELRELPQIIGGICEKSVAVARDLFSQITPTIIDVNSVEAAEMLKIMDNTYRDVTFAYANQVSILCDAFSIDMHSIVRAANSGYNRNNIPLPSPGVGGACLSKDPYIMASVCRNMGIDSTIFTNGRKINEEMPNYIIKRVFDAYREHCPTKKIKNVFVLGFAFKGKPDTSDMRDSPTLFVVDNLHDRHVEVWGHDPLVSKKDIESLGVVVKEIDQGVQQADAIIIMTNHRVYEDLQISDLIAKRESKVIISDQWSVLGLPKDHDKLSANRNFILV